MDPLILKKLNAARAERKASVVVTNLVDGRDRLVDEDMTVEGELGVAVSQALRSGKAAAVEIGGDTYFVNPHLPSPRLVIVGAVHISQALVPMARIAGYAPEVIDPRTAFATEERFPDTTIIADWPQEVFRSKPLDRYSAVAAITHDPKIDDYPIKSGLEAGCFYVGALGSRKTHAARLERLKSAGADEQALSQIRAPIGLDIGAASPQEIAVAIMGEIISSLRQRSLSDT